MNRHIPRRLFLGGAVSALSLLKTGVASYADPDGKAGVGNDSGPGGCSDPPSQLAEGKNRGWIDAHVHVWTPDVKRYPIDNRSFSVADMVPPSFTPQQLMAECQPSGVDRVVLIQMSFYNHDNLTFQFFHVSIHHPLLPFLLQYLLLRHFLIYNVDILQLYRCHPYTMDI